MVTELIELFQLLLATVRYFRVEVDELFLEAYYSDDVRNNVYNKAMYYRPANVCRSKRLLDFYNCRT
jgi:hypothetical protein